MKHKFKQIITKCPCGCGKIVNLNNNKPEKFEIISYKSNTIDILSIKRLSDNTIFKLGDTIKRITLLGKKYKRFVLFKIVITKQNHLLLWGFVVDTEGLVRIDNNAFINSNSNPNIFTTIYK